MIGLMASVQHQELALPLRGLVKTLSQVLLSVLCSGEDLELRISWDLEDLESRMRPTLVQPGYSHA